MSSSKRYKDLANHLRNTLGLTREFVLAYARETIREQVAHWLRHHYAGSHDMRKVVAEEAGKFFLRDGREVTRKMLEEWGVELDETTRRFLARKRDA